ncbi:uncharacterized protein PpBr36_10870 [Pyricularia pennisetigena]|uniref:uncharacterized protein n=1 Tax=Pyricularia pennisetigena TaxID=1578925 RepID=UPI00114F6B9E|nr:uncharacterized protein PpBr36_10870 [Pyricularia pennisetigena]TLS20861.1 hypothetical protein PpBr36_10870 [Pyricularia pennisetigena]
MLFLVFKYFVSAFLSQLRLTHKVQTVAFLIGKCIYNLFFHPLRHYPGPFLCRASRVFYLFWDIRGLSHWKVKQWHDRHGEVVRISPDELSMTHPEGWSAAYGFGAGGFDKDPKWWNKNVGGVDNILTADDRGHRRMRRLQNPAFSDRALRSQEPSMTRYVDMLIRQLHGQSSSAGPVVDINLWYSFTTFDLIGDLAFGEPFHCLRDGQWHWWLTAVFDIFKAGTYIRAARRFPTVLYYAILLCIVPKELLQMRERQYKFGVERINRRLEQTNTDKADFITHTAFLFLLLLLLLLSLPSVSYILQADDEKGMTVEEMYTSAQVLIVAGSETTATALTSGTYFILSNPHVHARLRAELDAAFASEADITLQSTQRSRLPYLHAVIDETLRIFPPGPGAFPRVVPDGGRTILGRFVPGGTTVGMHHLSVGRSRENYVLPDEFHPERWLAEDKRFDRDRKAASQPFSFGPRNCIGKNLALAELRLILARMFWNFDMELCPESKGWADRQQMYTTWKKTELPIKISPRIR